MSHGSVLERTKCELQGAGCRLAGRLCLGGEVDAELRGELLGPFGVVLGVLRQVGEGSIEGCLCSLG